MRRTLIFVPDDLYFFPNYTLKDMAIFYKSMYKNFDMEYLEKLATTLKLDMNSKIQNFSKGMKRQCAIICAICTNADYMFFDETFDGIDPVIRNLLKKIIAKQMINIWEHHINQKIFVTIWLYYIKEEFFLKVM